MANLAKFRHICYLHDDCARLHDDSARLHDGYARLHNGYARLHNGYARLHKDCAHLTKIESNVVLFTPKGTNKKATLIIR